MDVQGNFEPVYKMNKLGPVSVSGVPFPVKFRSVFGDPNLTEQGASRPDQESDGDSDLYDGESAVPAEPSEKLFYKDPLRLPDQFQSQEKEQEASSAVKLGKNMRASNGLGQKGDHKEFFKLMEEGYRLLNLQKEQQILYRRQIASEQTAAMLVHDLLVNGFNITPPDSTPRPVDNLGPSPDSRKLRTDDNDNQKSIVVGSQLIVAMHRELKRLQTNDATGN